MQPIILHLETEESLDDEPVYQLASDDLYDLDETELAELLELMEG